MCLHEDCDSSDRLYASKREWFQHELNVHSKHWSCDECQLTLKHEEEMRAHLDRVHTNKFSPTEVRTIIELSERVTSPSAPYSCPLCGRTTVHRRSHMARHLQRLALFVVPYRCFGANENDDGLSTFSGNSSRSNLKRRNQVRPTPTVMKFQHNVLPKTINLRTFQKGKLP